MLNSISRHFSSFTAMLAAPFQAVWRLIMRWFPERDFTIMDTPTGEVYAYHQTSFWRFAKACAKFGLVVWAFWATYVFIYHRPMLQKRTEQLSEMREQHARQMSDLDVYHKRFTELNRQLNLLDDKIQVAQSSKKFNQAAVDELMKQRINVWAQLDLLQSRLNQIFTEGGYAPEFTKLSELSLEYEIIRAQNAQLQQQNQDIAESAQAIAEADNQIVERVSVLARDHSEFLHSQLRKINTTLNLLGLSEKKLAQKAKSFSSPLVGSAISSINLDANLDPKYQNLADEVELWQSLARAREVMPLGAPVVKPRITSNYGTREDPIDGSTRQHKGMDFGGQIGTPLLAVAPGKVISAGDRFGYGKAVEIDHGLGFTTLYAHLSKINVRRGDYVRSNQVIGLAGSSGRSTGPHLHYEIRYNNAQFNPYSFVKAKD